MCIDFWSTHSFNATFVIVIVYKILFWIRIENYPTKYGLLSSKFLLFSNVIHKMHRINAKQITKFT